MQIRDSLPRDLATWLTSTDRPRLDELELEGLAWTEWEAIMARHNAVLRGGTHDGTTFAAIGPFTIEMGPIDDTVSVYVPTEEYEERDGHQLQVYEFTGTAPAI